MFSSPNRSSISESFGIECGRLAGLPESILSVAANRAAIMKVQVQQRIKQNRWVVRSGIYCLLIVATSPGCGK
jgi:DNA mismatch repair ATPase MutS